ncbi:MAG: glycosyl transferase [Lysobacteraceae bacterium]|nr:MAG: glycosyl transferase [Xanthomonadaceae bacterium]
MNQLTIAQLVPALNAGGVEHGTVEVARALVAQGHRSLVVSSGGRLVGSLTRDGSEHHKLDIATKSPLALLKVAPLRRWFLGQSVDIVHARSRLPAWLGYLAWRSIPKARRPRFITTVHGLNSINRYSRIMTRGERVIAVSDAVRDYVLSAYPDTPADKITVIHRGVDYQRFRFGFAPGKNWQDTWHRRFPVTRGRQLVTIVGRLSRLKGHAAFIELIERLSRSNKLVTGLIVGGVQTGREAYAGEIRQLIAERNLQDRIVLVGQRTDVREIMAMSSVVLSLSEKPEAFGRTVAEALALGTPVAGWDYGGVAEILQQIFPAGKVPVGDIEALTSRVAQFLASPPTVPNMTAYSSQVMVEKTLALYSSLAD